MSSEWREAINGSADGDVPKIAPPQSYYGRDEDRDWDTSAMTCPAPGCEVKESHKHGIHVCKPPASALPVEGSQERKDTPMARGCLDYFPAALAAVAQLSKAGNDKHNPGEDMHHARGKSMDHADCIMRHLVDRDKVDPEDGIPHVVKVAWRALALAQQYLEDNEGAPLAPAARLPEQKYDKRGTYESILSMEDGPPELPSELAKILHESETLEQQRYGTPYENRLGGELHDFHGRKFRETGEFRPPRKGEWYLGQDPGGTPYGPQKAFSDNDSYVKTSRRILEEVPS